MSVALWAVVAFFATLIAMPPLLRLLRSLGTFDVANHRSSHEGVVLRGAGLAITFGFVVALALSQKATSVSIAIAGIAVLLTSVGFWDDRHNLRPIPRLLGLLVAGGVLGVAVPLTSHPLVGCVAAALWVASAVNAYNFMDGINGISAMTAMVAGTALVIMGISANDDLVSAIGACALGASAAFLPFNAPRARAFMGDAGSYGVGFIVGAGAWTAWIGGIPMWVALAPLSIYLIDTATTLGLRAQQRKPLTEAHREHVYQRLVVSGWTHTQAAAFVATGAAIVFGLTFACWKLNLTALGIATWVAAALGYGIGVRLLAERMSALSQTG